MIDRKAALVGCRQGQWIRTQGMKGLRLNAKVQEGVTLRVSQIFDGIVSDITASRGIYQLGCAAWTRVEVIEGSHSDALCLLETS